MCSINHNLKALFIHIPKNGGSYVAEILSKYYGFKNYYLQRPDHKLFCTGKDKSVDKHENKIHGTLIYYKTSHYINKTMNMTKEKWDSYYIFTFVRNPYERIISGWNYINKYNIDFHKFVKFNEKSVSYDYWHVFMTQSRHLIDTNGKINVSFIGRLENIENDLGIVLNKLGIIRILHSPFKKNSKKHDDYKKYYINDDVLRCVNDIYNEDFNHFNYTQIADFEKFKNEI